MKQSTNINAFSLGLEELAMALGIINCADLGRDLITATYGALSPEVMDARLTSASHSLLARGLAAITKSGNPTLETRLEEALFPLARYDYLLQLSMVKEGGQATASVHVQKGKAFTSHSIQGGVVHVLEHGPNNLLAGYLQDLFGADIQNGKTSGQMQWSITPGILGQALKMKTAPEIQMLLQEQGLPDLDGQNLANDLLNQRLRGTILRVNAGPSLPMDAIKNAPKTMLLILQGQKHTWAFDFPGADDNLRGMAQVVNRASLQALFEKFVL